MFYNIHTHIADLQANHWALLNAREPFNNLPNYPHLSCGLHPWHVHNDTLSTQLHDLTLAARQLPVKAIGECGLDRVCATDWNLQLKAFQAQIALSNQLRKPLIIHCVRAHQEVLQQLRKYHHTQPTIFHGVNFKGIAALWQAGHFVSFGKALLQKNSQAAQHFAATPEDAYLLETDDSDITIEAVYEQAALLRNTNVETIMHQVSQNIQSILTV